jgi:hypothetical protein
MSERHKIKVIQPMAYIHMSKPFFTLYFLDYLIIYKTLFIEKEYERYMSLLFL